MDELLIALFAIFGGMARLGIDTLLPIAVFPVPTMLINLIGCFLLAFINATIAISQKFPAQLSLAMGTGMIGAFTTFSTFSLEIVKLIINHHLFVAAVYLIVSIVLGIIMAWLGDFIGKKITSQKMRGDQ
ncbi:fluoride efflux transporter FluC [Lentilactobacillus sp. SPB1-3]|uniref:CrcB family protein n=1 Tax=Lentilactobacillus terminaliae TaxID=3003483 RepID=A0ACD5DGB2_9LACO|nr:CrcB family protein [Lentilactobacillus sp. SPB1-3]MCZ0976715.1 CrcB family protein [Lentilactobacillus sp. SPB1-3]